MKLEWSALKQGKLKIGTVLGGWKEDAKEARENLRVVWEAISNFLVISSNVVFAKESGVAGSGTVHWSVGTAGTGTGTRWRKKMMAMVIFCETLDPS